MAADLKGETKRPLVIDFDSSLPKSHVMSLLIVEMKHQRNVQQNHSHSRLYSGCTMEQIEDGNDAAPYPFNSI